MNDTKTDISTTISEIQLFIAQLKKDLPEVFGSANQPTNANTGSAAVSPADDGKILFKGMLHNYTLVQDPQVNPEVVLADGCIRVHTDNAPENAPATMIENWMREHAEQVINARVKHWAELMGVNYNRVTVKDQKTLWGSCSEKSNLNFSWRVIKAPESVLDYLVIHELAHLKHLNHKTEFWQFVEQFCPDYKNRRRWLHDYKDSLFTEIPAPTEN